MFEHSKVTILLQLGVVLSRKIQWFLYVDFNKNKYDGSLTQSAAKDLGTSQFGNQLIFLGNGLSWRSEHQRILSFSNTVRVD